MEQSNRKLLKQRETGCDPVSERDSNRVSLKYTFSSRCSSFLSFLPFYDTTIFSRYQIYSPKESHRFFGTTKQGTGEGRKLDRGPTSKRLPRQREPEEKAGGQFLVFPKIETSISRSDRCQSAAHRCPPARKIDSVSIVSPGLVARRKISWEAKGDSLPFPFSPPLTSFLSFQPRSVFFLSLRFVIVDDSEILYLYWTS